MDNKKEFFTERINSIIKKIKERRELKRHWYQNKMDIERLQQVNKEIEKQIEAVDALIQVSYIPK